MSQDKRVARTKAALRNALLEIMKDKPIATVTTTELCREAGINRNTFYAHYPSPAALLKEMEDEYLALVLGIVDEMMPVSDYNSLLLQTCQAMLNFEPMSSMLFSPNGSPDFMDRIVETMQTHVMEMWSKMEPSLDRSDLELLHCYVTFGSQKCLTQWAEEGYREPPEVIAGKLSRISELLFRQFLNQKAI